MTKKPIPAASASIPRSPDSPILPKLLSWSRAQRRHLPWRGSKDPYRIWISEVMLQQTTVSAVRARYAGFLQRFPDVRALARAREDSVLAAWSGLGYYSRARNLWRAARRILREQDGRLPRDPASLRRLPGMGDYTAAAVACLSFGTRVPAADANVTRVVSRLFAIPGYAGTSRHTARVLSRVARLFPRHDPGRLLAALMDLGQLVCTSRSPACGVCPLYSECAALRRGAPERYPRRRPAAAAVAVSVASALVVEGPRALLVRRQSSYLDGLWEFPTADGRNAAEAKRRLARLLRTLGARLESSRPIAQTRHAVVNRRLRISIFPARLSAAGHGTGRWMIPAELSRAAIPTLTRKVAQAAGFLAPAKREYSVDQVIPAAALLLALTAAAPEPAGRMLLKNGTVYVLKEPPRISGGRIVFTTVEGKIYSLAESEVASITGPATPTPAPRGYSTQDSRALGAIARQQRNRKGKSAEVAPASAPTPRPPRKSKVARTATPRPS